MAAKTWVDTIYGIEYWNGTEWIWPFRNDGWVGINRADARRLAAKHRASGEYSKIRTCQFFRKK